MPTEGERVLRNYNAQIKQVDICIVTKTEKLPVNLRNAIDRLPAHSVIVETSTPLGLARMRAIRRVSTEWFVFLDDWVLIDLLGFMVRAGDILDRFKHHFVK